MPRPLHLIIVLVTEVYRDSVPCGHVLCHVSSVCSLTKDRNACPCALDFQQARKNRVEGVLVAVFVKAVLDVNESFR